MGSNTDCSSVSAHSYLIQLAKFDAKSLIDFVTSTSAFTDKPEPPTPDEITAELLQREADDQTKAWERDFILNHMFPNRQKHS